MKTILVTGGAGFIGSALIRSILSDTSAMVCNLDKLTYAGSQHSLHEISKHPRYRFERHDICDDHQVRRIFETYRPDAVVHLAAESHVDRSISGSSEFIHTNIVGTYCMLEAARSHWESLDDCAKSTFRFHHVSTDEVFGSLGPTGEFSESTPYNPRSPYSASKASADHLVRAWHHTYGLPILVTNCSNNYGPRQFPEKLIPLMIVNAIAGKPLPVYGDGKNLRDWHYVEDHADALLRVLQDGRIGETYNIGGNNEIANIDVVRTICIILDELHPAERRHDELIRFVKDRPGHDWRYKIDSTKIRRELGWQPRETFETGLRKTISWYLSNSEWLASVSGNQHTEWIARQYGDRK